jgi:tryptophan synthase beta chain
LPTPAPTKINNALGQALLTRRLGKSRVIAETGAGQHGVATATACALLDLPCVVFMGAEDIERQGPNVLRMRALGAEVRSVTSGTATLKDAVNEAMRAVGHERGDDPLRAGVGDGPRTRHRRSSATSSAGSATRPRPSWLRSRGGLPDLAVACVGGGSNAIGLLGAVHR